MVWFKVDDSLSTHPKVMAAGNEAMGLWVRAGSWCAQQLSDGFIPTSIVQMLAGSRSKSASRLVEAGLWTVSDGGYAFVNWAERQPSKDAVETRRAEDAERKARARAAKRRGSDDSVRDVSERTPSGLRAESEESPKDVRSASALPDPTRPDPTLTQNSTSSVEPANAGAQAVEAKRATRLPASWRPTDEHQQRAREAGVDIDREVIKFRTHAEDKGRTSKSWNAAFTQWLIKAAEYAQRDRPARQRTNQPSVDQWMFQ